MNSDADNPHADGLERMDGRRSIPSRLLGNPGPTDRQLARLLTSAVRVPDHGRLSPWRVLLIRGQTRAALGEILVARALERDPAVGGAVLDKERQRFLFAPVIITVIARLTPDHKVPEQEQLLSGGAVCFSLLQAAQALGFGAQWLTGWLAYDPVITSKLGLTGNERVLGFIHVGTSRDVVPERERPDPQTLLSELRL